MYVDEIAPGCNGFIAGGGGFFPAGVFLRRNVKPPEFVSGP